VSDRPDDAVTEFLGAAGATDARFGESACGSNCEEALERLEAYLDGELPGTDVQDIADHLSACYPCTDRTTFEEQLRSIVRRDCVDNAPASLIDRIRTHLTDLPTS
jgi:mycothiol system anti-sigma-R factor